MNTPEQVASDLQLRIAKLTTFDGDLLRYEMDATKKALLENPAACVLLLDEDIGSCVAALRKITGIALASVVKKPRRAGSKVVKLTPEAMAEGLEGM